MSCVTAYILLAAAPPRRAVARETTSVAAMEPRVVKPPGRETAGAPRCRYGLQGCLSEVRPGPARFAGSRICRLERRRRNLWRVA